jgi:hypothetical protein
MNLQPPITCQALGTCAALLARQELAAGPSCHGRPRPSWPRRRDGPPALPEARPRGSKGAWMQIVGFQVSPKLGRLTGPTDPGFPYSRGPRRSARVLPPAGTCSCCSTPSNLESHSGVFCLPFCGGRAEAAISEAVSLGIGGNHGGRWVRLKRVLISREALATATTGGRPGREPAAAIYTAATLAAGPWRHQFSRNKRETGNAPRVAWALPSTAPAAVQAQAGCGVYAAAPPARPGFLQPRAPRSPGPCWQHGPCPSPHVSHPGDQAQPAAVPDAQLRLTVAVPGRFH